MPQIDKPKCSYNFNHVSFRENSSIDVDVTGSFLNSFEDDNDCLGGVSVVQPESKKSEDGDDNESFQIVNGSVLLTPRKDFQSDISSDS